MKQQLVEIARGLLRHLPINATYKRKLQLFCFKHLSMFFRHLPSYQLWSLQNPAIATKDLLHIDLPKTRAEIMEKGGFTHKSPAILMVSHSLGGGTEHHLKQLGQKLEAEGLQVWALRSLGHDWVRLMSYDSLDGDALIYHLNDESDILLKQLEALDVRLIHVHHLVDFSEGLFHRIRSFAEQLKIPYDFTAHDYLSICPRYTLYDEAVRGYCGEPDIKRCQGCVKTFGSAAGKDIDVQKWRDDYANFLNNARNIYTPDLDVKQRLERYLPEANIINRQHWDETPITPLARKHKNGEPLRILTLGAIAPHKGSMILKECAEDAKKRNLPIEFTLIGFSDIDWLLKKYMKVTGPYKPKELPEMLKSGGFDAVFLPAVWPETFNYTLSEILHFGLFPICFDIGAIGRRVTELGYGSVLPYADYRKPEHINDALLGLNIPQIAPIEKLEAAQASYDNIIKDYYSLDISSST